MSKSNMIQILQHEGYKLVINCKRIISMEYKEDVSLVVRMNIPNLTYRWIGKEANSIYVVLFSTLDVIVLDGFGVPILPLPSRSSHLVGGGDPTVSDNGFSNQG